MAERAGRRLDSGDLAGFGMAAENAVAMAEVASSSASGKKPDRRGWRRARGSHGPSEDEAVAAGPARLVAPGAQHVVVEHPQDLDQRHRRADMAAPAAFQRLHDEPAQMARALVERRRHAIGVQIQDATRQVAHGLSIKSRTGPWPWRADASRPPRAPPRRHGRAPPISPAGTR